MNSTIHSLPAPAPLQRFGRAWLPRSIVARSTLAILLLASVLGALVGAAGAWMIQHSEQQHVRQQLDQLLATVESTASIACYVKDTALAREIGHGLMNNATVRGVRITSGGAVLDEQRRAGPATGNAEPALVISRTLYSPFKASEAVGEITLYTAGADIRAQAWIYTRFVLLVLALEVAVVAAGVALVVFNFITRPIKRISDELHGLEVRTGVHLRVPGRNREDEIGRLVDDVNGLIGKLTDLLDTEHRMFLERQASERRLALILEKVEAGIFELDVQGRLQSWNPAFAHILGKPPDPPLLAAIFAGEAQRLQDMIRGSLASAAPREGDFELPPRAPESPPRWVELSLTPVSERMLQGFVNDITERKLAEQAARQMAARDALTGLLNRRGLALGLDELFLRRRREPALGLAVLQVDLDYFKQVNDTYGHNAGDVVLRRVAAILEGAVRHSDLVARPGGDEFTVVLTGVESAGKPETIARNIIERVGKPIDIGEGRQAQIGASIGIALVGADETTPAAALHRADEAMYAAKQGGRNTVRVAEAAAA